MKITRKPKGGLGISQDYPWIGGINRSVESGDANPELPRNLRDMQMLQDGVWSWRKGVEKAYPDRGQHYGWTNDQSTRDIAVCGSEIWGGSYESLYYTSHKRKVFAFGYSNGVRYVYLGMVYSKTGAMQNEAPERDGVSEFQKFRLFRGKIDDVTGNVTWEGFSSSKTCARIDNHKYEQSTCFIDFSMRMNTAMDTLYIAFAIRNDFVATHSIVRLVKVTDLYTANWGVDSNDDDDDETPTWAIYKSLEALTSTIVVTHDIDIDTATTSTEYVTIIYGLFESGGSPEFYFKRQRVVDGTVTVLGFINSGTSDRYGCVIRRNSAVNSFGIAYIKVDADNTSSIVFYNTSDSSETVISTGLFAELINYASYEWSALGPVLGMTPDYVPVFCFRRESWNKVFVQVNTTGAEIPVTDRLDCNLQDVLSYPYPNSRWLLCGFDMVVRDGFLAVYYTTQGGGLTLGTYQIWRRTLIFDSADSEYTDGTFFQAELVEEYRDSPDVALKGYDRHTHLCAYHGGYAGDPEKWIAFIRFNAWVSENTVESNSSTVCCIRQDRGLVNGLKDISPKSIVSYNALAEDGLTEPITVIQTSDSLFYWRDLGYWRLIRGQRSEDNSQLVQRTTVDGRAFFWVLNKTLRAGVGTNIGNSPIVVERIDRRIYRNDEAEYVPATFASATFSSSGDVPILQLTARTAGAVGNLIHYAIDFALGLDAQSFLIPTYQLTLTGYGAGVSLAALSLQAMVNAVNQGDYGIDATILLNDGTSFADASGYLTGGENENFPVQAFGLYDRIFRLAKIERPTVPGSVDNNDSLAVALSNDTTPIVPVAASLDVKDNATNVKFTLVANRKGTYGNSITFKYNVSAGDNFIQISDADESFYFTANLGDLVENLVGLINSHQTAVTAIAKSDLSVANVSDLAYIDTTNLAGGVDGDERYAEFYEPAPGESYPVANIVSSKLESVSPTPRVSHPFKIIHPSNVATEIAQPYIEVFFGFAFRYDNGQISQISLFEEPAPFKLGFAITDEVALPADNVAFTGTPFPMIGFDFNLRRWTASEKPGDPRWTSLLIFMSRQMSEGQTAFDSMLEDGRLIKEILVAKDVEQFKAEPENGDSEWTEVDDNYVSLTTWVDFKNFKKTWEQTPGVIEYIGHANPIYKSDQDTPSLDGYKYATTVNGRPFYGNLRINGKLHEDFVMWAGELLLGGVSVITPDVTGLDYLHQPNFKIMGLFSMDDKHVVIGGDTDIEVGSVEGTELQWAFLKTLGDIGVLAPRTMTKIAMTGETGGLSGMYFMSEGGVGRFFDLYRSPVFGNEILKSFIAGTNPSATRVETTYEGTKSLADEFAMALHLQTERLFLIHFPTDGITFVRDFNAELNSGKIIWVVWYLNPSPTAWCEKVDNGKLLYIDDSQVYQHPRASETVLDDTTSTAPSGRLPDLKLPSTVFSIPFRAFVKYKLHKKSGAAGDPALLITFHKDDGSRLDMTLTFPYSDVMVTKEKIFGLAPGFAEQVVSISWSIQNASYADGFDLHSISIELDGESR